MATNDNILKTLIDSLVNQLQEILIKLNEIDGTTKRIEGLTNDNSDSLAEINIKTNKLSNVESISVDVGILKTNVQTALFDLEQLKKSMSPVSKLSSYLSTPLGVIIFLIGLVLATTSLTKVFDWAGGKLHHQPEKEVIDYYTPCTIDHVTGSLKPVSQHFHAVMKKTN